MDAMARLDQAQTNLYAILKAHEKDGVQDPGEATLDAVLGGLVIALAHMPEEEHRFDDVLAAAREAFDAQRAVEPARWEGMADFDGVLRFWRSTNVLSPREE